MRTAQRFDAPADGRLTDEMKAAYEHEGFLVLQGFADASAIAALRRRIDELVEGFDERSVRTIFSAEAQSHAADAYFRESGDDIRFFFEAGAFVGDGALQAPKRRALNKIGHAMHDLDPVFDRFCRTPELAEVARGVGLADPGLVQSMVIFKQPRIGGGVGMHQDATFLHTEPVSVTGFWFALEDADAGNGCLLALPGGHRGTLKERFHYDGDRLVLSPLSPANWPEDELVALEAPAGTLVVLHGLLPHGSAPNTSARSREAFTLHAVDRAARWSPDNWLKRREDMPVRGFA